MSKPPNLTLTVLPVENGNATYLKLAPPRAGGKASIKLILCVSITNNEDKDVIVTGISFSFPGTDREKIDMEGVSLAVDPAGEVGASTAGGKIPKGSSALWSNGRIDLDRSEEGEDFRDNRVFLTGTPPRKVRVHVTCAGFLNPAIVTYDLVRTEIASPTRAFFFPFSSGDLRAGEYVVTEASHWANGGASGVQIFAHDIGVEAVTDGAWSHLLPGKPDTQNESYRIWGLPVRAMADGTVDTFRDGIASNTSLNEFPENVQVGGGNHFWIKHGDLYAVYAHLQDGTQPESLLRHGAPVRAGQILGLAGNSGRSSNPHLHIAVLKGGGEDIGTLHSIPFRGSQVIDHEDYKPPTVSDPWFLMTGQGIPKNAASIWPGTTTPGFPIPAAGIARSGAWTNTHWMSTSRAKFEQTAQELFTKQKLRLVWATTYLENGHRRWVGIARSGDWASAFWISSSRSAFETAAQKLFTDEGKRLIHVHTYAEGNKRYWMGIARSGTWASSFWISETRAAFEKKAQDLFDKKQQRLTFVHTYPEGNKRHWVGIAQSGTWANSFFIREGFRAFNTEAQRLFDEQGRRLVHVHTYVDNGKRFWAGISRNGDWGNSFYYEKDLDQFNRTTQNLLDKDGRRVVAVEFIDT